MSHSEPIAGLPPRPLRVGAIIPASNEAANIGLLLDRLSGEPLDGVAAWAEFIVVASGCTDATISIVRERQASDPRVRLVVEEERTGKASALNLAFGQREAGLDLVTIVSADVLPKPGAVRRIFEVMRDEPDVGMAGGRPTPTGTNGSFVGGMVRFLWTLHDARSLESPKLGELVVLRDALARQLPPNCSADEAHLEATVVAQGLRLRYVRESLLLNSGPNTLRDYVHHRRRIAEGHHTVRRSEGYAVSTLAWLPVVRLALRQLWRAPLREKPSGLGAIAIELVARSLGLFDALRGRPHRVWRMFDSARAPAAHPLEASLP